MENRNVYHVTKHPDGWQGKLEGAGRASVTGSNKQEVTDKTIELAHNNQPSQVLIHKEDGTIQEERTFPRSSDPYPPQG